MCFLEFCELFYQITKSKGEGKVSFLSGRTDHVCNLGNYYLQLASEMGRQLVGPGP